jgi:hypothetical protein
MFKEPYVGVLGKKLKNSLEQAQKLHGKQNQAAVLRGSGSFATQLMEAAPITDSREPLPEFSPSAKPDCESRHHGSCFSERAH